jgi:Phage tail assembly chaperone protein
MSDQRILWQMPDGTLRVTVPVNRLQPLDEIARRVQAAVLELRAAQRLPDCLAEDLPPSRWRTCWRADAAGRAQVDLPLARAQRLAEIRAERDARLATSDAAMLREQEQGTEQGVAALRAYRQALRDLPGDLEQSVALQALEDVQALEAFAPPWPAPPFDLGAGPGAH